MTQQYHIEVEAMINTGAVMPVLTKNIVDELRLKKIRDVKVKYANNKEVLAEEVGSQPLIGQIVLESLDLIVDLITRRVIPDLRSPESPMVEVL